MNYFSIAITILQVGACLWEWSHGRFYAGLFYLGCVIGNVAVLGGMPK